MFIHLLILSRKIGSGILLAMILVASTARGQTLQALHSFQGTDGAEPVAGLVLGSDGNFYGTTSLGGTSNLGTVFRITPAGTLTTLVSFIGSNGRNPVAGLLLGSDNNFYGTTRGGGTSDLGTVFRMTPGGALTTVVNFNVSNGADPRTGLVQGSDGNFYGTTVLGGASNLGTLFRMLPNGTLTTLFSFAGDNGAYPTGGLLEENGYFYGTTSSGGTTYDGTIFRITPNGAFTSLLSFRYGFPPNHGPAQPEAGLVQGTDGDFYGTTAVGGSGNPIGQDAGTVFKISPDGVLTTLVSFNNTNGSGPLAGLVRGGDGNFYGTTSGGGTAYDPQNNYGAGTIFVITPDGTLTSLFTFTNTDGASPQAGHIFGSEGHLYGTTSKGGANDKGTIFKLVVPTLPAPTNLTAIAGDGQVILTWDASAGAATYTVARRTTSTSYSDLATGITGTTFTDTTAGNGTQWFYVVYAVNGNEESWSSNETSALPNAPPSVSVTNPVDAATYVAPAQVKIAAQASDPDGLVQQVAFFQGTTLLGIDASAPFEMTWNNVAAGNYAITAQATDNAGATTNSVAVNITVIEPTPPVPPSALTARALSSTRLKLRWTDNATDESGYKIERSRKNKPFKEIARLGANATQFTDRNLAAGQKYFYRVRAFNLGGDSPYSNTASAKTLP